RPAGPADAPQGDGRPRPRSAERPDAPAPAPGAAAASPRHRTVRDPPARGAPHHRSRRVSMNQPQIHIARAPSIDDFAALAEAALDALPEAFRRMAGDVVFRIEEFPSELVLSELEIDDPFDLTGLYSGAP